MSKKSPLSHGGFEHRMGLMSKSMAGCVLEEYDFIQRSIIVNLSIGAQCSNCKVTAYSWNGVLEKFVVRDFFPNVHLMSEFQKKCHRTNAAVPPQKYDAKSNIKIAIDLKCSGCGREGTINRSMFYADVMGHDWTGSKVKTP